jgi:predicted enzyme related to lactoylglutathione lyase
MAWGPLRPDAFRLDRIAFRRPRSCRLRRFCRTGVATALLGIAVTTATLATPPPMPAPKEPASQEHHAGKIVWIQLVTPDLAAAKSFYAGLFGWTFQDVPPGANQYAEATLNGYPVAGIFQKPIKAGEHRQPAWLGFISTGDVDATTKIALQHGAKLLFGPHDIPNLGRDAVLTDPQGAVFAVLASSHSDPPDILARPGDWIWSSLITSDPDTSAAFYQTLFDYEVFNLPSDKSAGHFILSSGGYARASVNSLPADAAHVHPHWLYYVRVRNVDTTAAKVVALGGRVLVEPRIDRQGGKIAVVADPLGGPFGLLEWPGNQDNEVNQ